MANKARGSASYAVRRSQAAAARRAKAKAVRAARKAKKVETGE